MQFSRIPWYPKGLLGGWQGGCGLLSSRQILELV